MAKRPAVAIANRLMKKMPQNDPLSDRLRVRKIAKNGSHAATAIDPFRMDFGKTILQTLSQPRLS